ncbi:hypothetical protein Ctob_012343 [Chrysochromulina tobinii]|uniref:Uncharacterized protein n=1 Tax=Chrysochromulina tobinii TaxID=1460289 RepID=A0A0M0K902_9EUKA|nr:hypothetical protein Ctob_012343 [Chrysochromulina tobinii]|eukprot:KOO35284.1 hypothetical protein Ctob_012343 [Chrysochromulina sp. CCMP291]
MSAPSRMSSGLKSRFTTAPLSSRHWRVQVEEGVLVAWRRMRRRWSHVRGLCDAPRAGGGAGARGRPLSATADRGGCRRASAGRRGTARRRPVLQTVAEQTAARAVGCTAAAHSPRAAGRRYRARPTWRA